MKVQLAVDMIVPKMCKRKKNPVLLDHLQIKLFIYYVCLNITCSNFLLYFSRSEVTTLGSWLELFLLDLLISIEQMLNDISRIRNMKGPWTQWLSWAEKPSNASTTVRLHLNTSQSQNKDSRQTQITLLWIWYRQRLPAFFWSKVKPLNEQERIMTPATWLSLSWTSRLFLIVCINAHNY